MQKKTKNHSTTIRKLVGLCDFSLIRVMWTFTVLQSLN
uniref:Uncharacterized protein n=1 Tax=Anguilla anguilla TaxID=7936 RepID=A0A0E9WG19_ANGAN